MSGTWVFVCGPSGAGKDSVLRWAMQSLKDEAQVIAARRVVTRSAAAHDGDEELSRTAFAEAVTRGAMAWHWDAHGCRYGVPSAHTDDVANGRIVVVNGSREHVAGLPADAGVRVIQITASAELLARRLAARNREDAAAQHARLARSEQLPPVSADLVIRNEGEIAVAGQQLANALRAESQRPRTAGALQVRSMLTADALQLVPLLTQLGYPGCEAFIGDRLAALLSHPDALHRVAVRDGRVVGFISVHFVAQLARAGDFCRVSYLCVDEAVRGHGVGAMLLREVEGHARERGCDRIELHSAERRVDAHRFYAREGYVESPKYLMKMVRG